MNLLGTVLPMTLIEKIGHQTRTHHKLLLYMAIGASGVLLDLILFLALYNVMQIDKNIATFISTSTGIGNNFLWNAHLNFRVKNQLVRRLTQFYAVGITGVILTIIIFWLFVDLLGFGANIVKIGSLLPVVLLQYSLNKSWTFRKAT